MQAERTITYHTVTLGTMTREGHTLAEIVERDEQGIARTRTLPVPAGLPGERVTIAVEEPARPPAGKRKRRWKQRPPRAWITEIHATSPLRVSAPCPVFGTCGGCQLQHMQYTAQLEWKRSIVRELLCDVGGFDDPPLLEAVPCDTPWHYRNHMRFSVNREGQAGLTARGSHRVLPLVSCPIAHAQINRVLEVLSTQPNPRPQVLIRCGTATNQVLLQPAPAPEVAQCLLEAGIDVRTETMEEVLAGETFRIRPSSFFQTNSAQAEKMVQMVVDGLLGHATTIVDAYCGVGTFALLLAKHFDKVIAIEESASAIKDARENLRDVPNVEIRKGKVEDVLPNLAAQVDGLVIDPPRAGCQLVVLDALIEHPVARIVYVSCDPSTLARDLDILCHTHPTYRLCSVQPLDMFPQTAHIECIAVLECLYR
ncbi:MAG TPA: class I SAM-dependent RNA methyltransferase [Ktedonobacteraceae bacterium]|nr:class I SAM-dependent RNA methyltransferase [Ktedonobacteraceae bacterium]